MRERARELGSPTELVYGQLFTSYIQPPTSALHIAPLTALPWRDATRVYLVLNHLLLAAGVALTLGTIRPELPLRLLLPVVAVILLLYSQIYGSLTLGQVDPTMLLLLSAGFWGYARGRPAVAGISIALAAAIKLLPGLLLLFFLWKRQYRAFAWGAVAGLAMLLLSLAWVGPGTYETYLTETLPALSKGSTQYANISLGAALARLTSPEVIRGRPAADYYDELPDSEWRRLGSLALLAGGLTVLALVTGRNGADAAMAEASARAPTQDYVRRRFLEYYLVVAGALLLSSVTWEFYVIWLLPVFLVFFTSPRRMLPDGRLRVLVLAALGLALVALNLPGDFYLFAPNDFFYHPEWVPGVWAEERVRLYNTHLDAVIFLRLPALLLVAGLLAGLVLLDRVRAQRSVAVAVAAGVRRLSA